MAKHETDAGVVARGQAAALRERAARLLPQLADAFSCQPGECAQCDLIRQARSIMQEIARG